MSLDARELAAADQPSPVRRIACVVNRAAGSREVPGALEQACRRRRDVESVVVQCATTEEIRQAVREHRASCDVVAVAGGDGTLRVAASELLDSGAALAVIPAGTFNHFARASGLPLDAERALDVAIRGRTRHVDVGDAGGRLFLNTLVLGSYVDSLRLRAKWRPRIGRWPAFVVASVVVLSRFGRARLAMEIDGTPLDRKLTFAWIGNNEYEYERPWPDFGKRDALDCSCLTLAITPSESAREFVVDALRVLRGGFAVTRELELRRATSVTVRSQRHGPLHAALDGDHHELPQPLVVSVRPLALRLRVPAQGPEPS